LVRLCCSVKLQRAGGFAYSRTVRRIADAGFVTLYSDCGLKRCTSWPAGGCCLAFLKRSCVATLVDNNEAVCAVRNLRRRAGQRCVVVVVMAHAKDRRGRSRVTDRINL